MQPIPPFPNGSKEAFYGSYESPPPKAILVDEYESRVQQLLGNAPKPVSQEERRRARHTREHYQLGPGRRLLMMRQGYKRKGAPEEQREEPRLVTVVRWDNAFSTICSAHLGPGSQSAHHGINTTLRMCSQSTLGISKEMVMKVINMCNICRPGGAHSRNSTPHHPTSNQEVSSTVNTLRDVPSQEVHAATSVSCPYKDLKLSDIFEAIRKARPVLVERSVQTDLSMSEEG